MIKELEMNAQAIDHIMTIWSEATIDAHPFISKSYWMDNYDAVKDIYLPMSKTFIYEDKGEIVGFISILKDAFIGALFVTVHQQGQGIGSQLLQYVKQRYKHLSLAVYKDNLKAVAFYKRQGFVVDCEQINEETQVKELMMSIDCE